MVRYRFLALAVVTTVGLTGCYSTRYEGVEDRSVRAGDLLYVSVEMKGQTILEKTYRHYSVDEAGDLSQIPAANNAALPRITLLESVYLPPPSANGVQVKVLEPLPLDTARGFYRALWTAYGEYYPDMTSEQRARQIGDLDASIETLYREYQGSGLAMKDLVAMYENLERYFGSDAIEGQLRDFLERSRISHHVLLSTLTQIGTSWDELLKTMANRKVGFIDLYNDFARSKLTLELFLRDFLGVQSSRSVFADNAGIDVAKFAWEIIKDGKPMTTADGAYTTVLSTKDTSYENYGNAIHGTSDKIHYRVHDLVGLTLVESHFSLEGYYGAVNPNFGGSWLPSVAFLVDDAFAAFSWTLNASASITSTANTGTVAEPKPEIEVIAKIQANGWFRSYSDSFTFYANGATGFRTDGVTSVDH